MKAWLRHRVPIIFPWGVLLAACQCNSLLAQCEALVRLPGNGALSIAKQDGTVIRQLTEEAVSLAAWSPDGKYVASSYGMSTIGTKLVGEIGLMTREGVLLSRLRQESDFDNVYETAFGWSRPDVLWQRVSGHASSFVTFWQVPPTLDLNRSKVLGRGWGDHCAPSPDFSAIACAEAGHISVVKGGDSLSLNSNLIYPPSSLTPANQRASLDLDLGQSKQTKTDPVFQVQVSRGTPAMEGRVVLEVTGPQGYPRGAYLTGEGDEIPPVDMEGADWHFVLHSLDSGRRRFRITVYEDDSKRELSGMAWSRDGSRLLTWEATRHGSGPLVLVRSGNRWSSERSPATIQTAEVLRVRFGPDDSAILVETPTAVYRCGVDDHPVCAVVATHPGALLDVRVGDSVVRADVLDWRCPIGGN